ncbi:MAG TPA: sugar phosphate isomerase/epimerase [Limnochordia bacterium]|nr:sugar phosphate isomerase/epimerase [Limnochordia bacterium]
MANPNITLSMNTSTIRPTPLLEKIKAVGEAGFRAIELWNDEMNTYLNGGGSLAELKRALADYGLTVANVVGVGGWADVTDEAALAKAIEQAKPNMAQAAEVGSPYIIAGPPRGECDLERAGRNYAALIEAGKALGITPAAEFLGFVGYVNTIDRCRRIVAAAAHPDACLVVDPFHIFRGGGSIDEIDQVPGERIAVFHFNDAPAHPDRAEQADKDRVFPGDGILPLVEWTRRIVGRGYRGVISLELFNPSHYERDPREVAKEGFRKMSRVLEAAGVL